MSNDNAGGLLSNPLPIVMVALLAAGVLIKQVPLQSARPNDSERVKFVPAAQQDVEARLWQDPFAAVAKYEGPSKTETHTTKKLRDRIQEISEGGRQVRIIGVSVFGGSYSEGAESRRRTRFAILSALGFHGYSPANPDAIGYFHIKLQDGDKQVTWPAPGDDGLDFNLIGPAGSTMLLELVRERSDPYPPVDLTVPYEWFERGKSPSDVLVLWLSEDKLTTGPLMKLRSLIAELTPSQSFGRPTPPNESKQNLPIPAKMFVPSATIPGCDLDTSMPKKPWNCFMMELPELQKKLTDLSVVRVIGTDDVLAAGLLWELWQRGVNRELGYEDNWWKRKWAQLVKGQDPATFPRQCADGLVLISEWDSDYARALSRNLTDGFSERCKANGNFSPPVRSFSYLRGLDGILPDIDKSSANAPRKDDNGKSKDLRAQLEDAPPEHAEGRSQYDYLRRLGDEIARLDGDDRRFADNGVKAIGIVGSDVYDKLLILQALRSRFKDKIFFTTDLDARYLHADQKEWARNLVVASNFDLSLRPELQQSTLPFRDGYQTATYLATLMALEDKPLDYWSDNMKEWLRPQIFEIGRTEAVHVASPSVPELKEWITGYSDGSAPSAVSATPWRTRNKGKSAYSKDSAVVEDKICEDDWARCKNIEPERPPRGLPLKHLLAIISMIFLGTASLAMVSRHIQQTVYAALNSAKPEDAWSAKLWLIGAAALLLTVIATVVGLNSAMSASSAQGAEPFVWLEGVSVWPSLVLRFLGLITVIVLVIASTLWMRQQAQLTSRRFDLPMPQTRKLARSRWSAGRNGPNIDLASFGPEGESSVKHAGAPLEIASLWQNYMRATGWREMTGWILTSTVIVSLLGFVPYYLFGRPSFPHRGQLVEMLYHILERLNGPFLWLIIFWVSYETRACARFIEILSEVPSVWPKSLLDREEAKTSVPRAHLDDYLDFQLIVLATGRIHWLIYLPFVLLLFLVLARSSIFDAMDFPLALIFVTGLALAYALYTAVLLRRSAEAARAKALEHYEARLLAQARLKESPPAPTANAVAANPTPISAEQIKLLMERIRSTREGAFAPFTQQPALHALLLPFGGYGSVQLVEYLINF